VSETPQNPSQDRSDAAQNQPTEPLGAGSQQDNRPPEPNQPWFGVTQPQAPVPGAYPQAGYPQAGYPQAGYPQAGYPQAGYPQAGYPQGAAYPSAEFGQSTGPEPTPPAPAQPAAPAPWYGGSADATQEWYAGSQTAPGQPGQPGQPRQDGPTHETVGQFDPNWAAPQVAAESAAPRTSSLHKHRGAVVGAALVAAGALAGAAISHTAWQSGPKLASQQGGVTSPNSSGTGSSGSSGSGSNSNPFGGFGGFGGSGSGSNSDPFGGFGGSGSGSGTGSGSSGTGTSSAGALQPAADAVSPGLVDINTTLGGSGGAAAGTGIVMSSDGTVLTNNHVINGATSISVTDIGNGKTYTAKVVGYDITDDVAVIKLQNASGLQTAPIGNSSSVRVGDSVVGVGNAGGVGGTPSAAAGTVSALNQSITASDSGDGTSEQLSGLIQINADIQPGDSGGPLVNSSGKVVGIDTAGSSATGTTGGTTGFAIPINTALSIAHKIQNGQQSSTVHIGETAFLGIQVSSSTGSGQGTSGVPVAGVVSGTPAASAGLAAGDTITSVDGNSVNPSSLRDVLAQHHPGDSVSVTWVDSSGQQHNANVQLAQGPAA
jgi:S1-C subfamily serine protease